MDKTKIQGELEAFADKRLNAEAFPDCTHRFRLYECKQCGGIAYSVTLERCRNDTPGDFHGALKTCCAACGHVTEVQYKVPLGVVQESIAERPSCTCGGDIFHLGQCDRWENWGFFDEGTIVAMCGRCGTLRELIDLD